MTYRSGMTCADGCLDPHRWTGLIDWIVGRMTFIDLTEGNRSGRRCA
ncbi:MAG: hypothetical protein AAFO01_22580 [Pseudomonadota bacterium]